MNIARWLVTPFYYFSLSLWCGWWRQIRVWHSPLTLGPQQCVYAVFPCLSIWFSFSCCITQCSSWATFDKYVDLLLFVNWILYFWRCRLIRVPVGTPWGPILKSKAVQQSRLAISRSVICHFLSVFVSNEILRIRLCIVKDDVHLSYSCSSLWRIVIWRFRVIKLICCAVE